MIRSIASTNTMQLAMLSGPSLAERLPALQSFALRKPLTALSADPHWLQVLHDGFGHETYAMEATVAGATCGYLPLAYVSSVLFGRFLVSLPYLNSNGVVADAPDVQTALIDRAIELADELRVRHLELRHEQPIDHVRFNQQLTSKVHMRVDLPETTEKLWKGYDTKVRNQVRKGEKNDFTICWGAEDLLDDFYQVLSRNMRDLGTPVYGRSLFRSILQTFPNKAEICCLKAGDKPIATALLLHGAGITEVPTASSLRAFNSTCANMLMYRHLLDRAVERGQKVFDFGRSTTDGPTFKFKKQWGCEAHPAMWQYVVRSGSVGDVRPDNPRYQRMIRWWQRLPVKVTQVIGPPIVRGIP